MATTSSAACFAMNRPKLLLHPMRIVCMGECLLFCAACCSFCLQTLNATPTLMLRSCASEAERSPLPSPASEHLMQSRAPFALQKLQLRQRLRRRRRQRSQVALRAGNIGCWLLRLQLRRFMVKFARSRLQNRLGPAQDSTLCD